MLPHLHPRNLPNLPDLITLSYLLTRCVYLFRSIPFLSFFLQRVSVLDTCGLIYLFTA